MPPNNALQRTLTCGLRPSVRAAERERSAPVETLPPCNRYVELRTLPIRGPCPRSIRSDRMRRRTHFRDREVA